MDFITEVIIKITAAAAAKIILNNTNHIIVVYLFDLEKTLNASPATLAAVLQAWQSRLVHPFRPG